MVNMSAKCDKEICNGVVSIVFTRSTHGRTDGRNHARTDGPNHSSVTTFVYPHRNALRGDKKRLHLRCIHHFKSALINNVDHMRILGTDPSSVIRSQTNTFKKLKSGAQKVPKQTKAKRDGVINSQNYNFVQIQILSKCYESSKVDRKTLLHVPSRAVSSISSDISTK